MPLRLKDDVWLRVYTDAVAMMLARTALIDGSSLSFMPVDYAEICARAESLAKEMVPIVLRNCPRLAHLENLSKPASVEPEQLWEGFGGALRFVANVEGNTVTFTDGTTGSASWMLDSSSGFYRYFGNL